MTVCELRIDGSLDGRDDRREMIDQEQALAAYVQLALLSHEKGQRPARDRFLLLAGACACRAGLLAAAEGCRQIIVAGSPGHQLAGYDTFPAAMRSADFRLLVERWEKRFSYEVVEHLLLQLGRTPRGVAEGERVDEFVLACLDAISPAG